MASFPIGSSFITSATAAVSLEGYSLTDSFNTPRKWRLPAVTLAAGDYLTVFASSKDRATPGARCTPIFVFPGKANTWP